MGRGPLKGPLAPGTRTLGLDLLGLVGLVSLIPGRSNIICGLEGSSGTWGQDIGSGSPGSCWLAVIDSRQVKDNL